MKYSFIIVNGILLSLIGISAILLEYVFDYSSIEFSFIRAILALILIVFFIRQYVSQISGITSMQGFVSYYLTFISILFLSSFLNLSLEYSLYNHIDTAYKYELEEKEFQRVYEHREKKGLPSNSRLSNEEIEEKYGMVGLFGINQPVYVLNFIVVLVLYLAGIFFNHMKEGTKVPAT